MARIRDVKTGQLFEGPDDAPVPAGFEKVTAPAAASAEPGYLERTTTRAVDRAKEIATFPYRVGRLVTGADKPESFEDVALLAMGNVPLIAAGGGVANLAHVPKLAPLARVATSFGLAKGRGEDTTTAALEAAGAGMAEGAGALASKALGGPARGLDAVRDKLGGAGGALNRQHLDALLKWWQEAGNPAAKAQRALRVAANLRGMDPSGEAARIFKEMVAKGMGLPFTRRTLPAASPGFSRAAEAVATSPVARSAADAAMSSDPTAAAVPIIVGSQLSPRSLVNAVLP